MKPEKQSLSKNISSQEFNNYLQEGKTYNNRDKKKYREKTIFFYNLFSKLTFFLVKLNVKKLVPLPSSVIGTTLLRKIMGF